MLVLSSSCGEGGGKGSPLGNPLPGAPLKMVQTLPGQSHLPLPTRTHFWLRSSWYPHIETLKLDSVTPSLGPPGPPPLAVAIPHAWGIFTSKDRLPRIGISPLALVEFIRPSVQPASHPSLSSAPLGRPAPLAGGAPHHQLGLPVMAACALPLPHHTHPYDGAPGPGCEGLCQLGQQESPPNLGLPPRSTVSPSLPRATVLQSIFPPPRPSLCLAVIDQ